MPSLFALTQFLPRFSFCIQRTPVYTPPSLLPASPTSQKHQFPPPTAGHRRLSRGENRLLHTIVSAFCSWTRTWILFFSFLPLYYVFNQRDGSTRIYVMEMMDGINDGNFCIWWFSRGNQPKSTLSLLQFDGRSY
ncbi:unnamed protein product [Lactuca virosa]|uniref:Uncharacterized protein n=1 Tax=Lactuca virosa TaxID=75947 RepID=A0AAU9MC85_9ASTR|nr:unnamed protein product [Lactuca virosa]